MPRRTLIFSTLATALVLSLGAAEARPWSRHELGGFWHVTHVDRHDHLNVRAGPGTNFPVVHELRPRARYLEKVVCTPTVKRRHFQRLPQRIRRQINRMPVWCLIERNGRHIGWVNARFLAR